MIQLDDDIEATHWQKHFLISEWEDLISITGGCMAPDKSAWYLVNYNWRWGKWKFTNLVQERVLEANNKAVTPPPPLRYLHANEAMLMLGMYLTPDGKNKDQVEYMHKKATTWATSIRAEVVQHNKALKDLNYTIPQIMKYSLPAMKQNRKEFKHTMQPIVKFELTKSGISSTLHMAVRYGPRYIGRIGIFELIVIQGEFWIYFLIKHWWKPTPCIPILRDNLFNIQLEAGRGRRILEDEYPKT